MSGGRGTETAGSDCVPDPSYHPAKKDGILNSLGIFYAIRWHNIFEIPLPWNILCHPLLETWLPEKFGVTLHIRGRPCPDFRR